MTATLRLTEIDHVIAEALVRKVKLFSQRQIANRWCEGEISNARRRMRRVFLAGLAEPVTVHARSLPDLLAPLITWRPNDPAPDCGAIAYRCQQRWRHTAVRPCTAWIATEKAAQLYGGLRRSGLKQPMQATHDLGTSAVWLCLSQVAPELAAAWRSEDLLAHTRRGEKLPDAFLVDQNNQVAWVIEFGGAYDSARVQAFHQDCLSRQLPYQLW